MKRTTTMMIATAALLAAAATGSAQSMKAEIPFRFDAGGAHMEPGTYQVYLNHTKSGTYILQIFNMDDRHSTFALAQTVERPARTAASGSDVVLDLPMHRRPLCAVAALGRQHIRVQLRDR